MIHPLGATGVQYQSVQRSTTPNEHQQQMNDGFEPNQVSFENGYEEVDVPNRDLRFEN